MTVAVEAAVWICIRDRTIITWTSKMEHRSGLLLLLNVRPSVRVGVSVSRPGGLWEGGSRISRIQQSCRIPGFVEESWCTICIPRTSIRLPCLCIPICKPSTHPGSRAQKREGCLATTGDSPPPAALLSAIFNSLYCA